MKSFRVWAVQVLHDARDVEADSVEEARRKAEHMYDKTGELDPEEVIEGGYGVVGDTEFVFDQRPCTKEKTQDSYLACPECGCTDVEITAWVCANTDKISDGDGPGDQAWCPQCEANGVDGSMKEGHLEHVDTAKPFVQPDEISTVRCPPAAPLP